MRETGREGGREGVKMISTEEGRLIGFRTTFGASNSGLFVVFMYRERPFSLIILLLFNSL